MKSYVFVFGRTPDLSLVELVQFFPQTKLIASNVARVDADLTASEMIDILGGTVKIAEVIGESANLTAPILTEHFLTNGITQTKSFGISWYGEIPKDNSSFLRLIKDSLTAKGISSRYKESRQGMELSSVVIAKQEVCELCIIGYQKTFVIAKTIAVQPFESWSKRDFDRPYADTKRGMLPPKVARMIVNLALGNDAEGKTLLDPFCGMGTILGEALLRKALIIGSDIEANVIDKAKKNLIWLFPDQKELLRLFVSDATHVSQQIKESSLDAIATEPFLGDPAIGERKIKDPKAIKNKIKGLEKLYIGSLREWYDLLKPKGKVVIAFPTFHIEDRIYGVKNVVDSCENLGYTKLLGPLTYGRTDAIVKRNFFLFEKKYGAY